MANQNHLNLSDDSVLHEESKSNRIEQGLRNNLRSHS